MITDFNESGTSRIEKKVVNLYTETEIFTSQQLLEHAAFEKETEDL